MELKVKGPSLSTGADFWIVKNNGSVDATASPTPQGRMPRLL